MEKYSAEAAKEGPSPAESGRGTGREVPPERRAEHGLGLESRPDGDSV